MQRANQATMRLLGWTIDELRESGKWTELVHPEDSEATVRSFARLSFGQVGVRP